MHGSAHVRVLLIGDLWPGEPEHARPLPIFRLSPDAITTHPQPGDTDRRPLAIVGEGWHARLLALPNWDMFRAKAATARKGDPLPDSSAIARRLEGYAALLAHARTGGHLFVTEDKELLTGQHEPLWHGVYMCSRLEAIAIAGALARLRNRMEYDFDEDGEPEPIVSAADAYRWMIDPLMHGLDRLPYRGLDGVVDEPVDAMRERLSWLTIARDQVVVAVVPHGYNEASVPAILALSTLAVAAKALMDSCCDAAIRLFGLRAAVKTKGVWRLESRRCRTNWNAMSLSLKHSPHPRPWSHARLVQACEDSTVTATMNVIGALRNAVAHAEPLRYSHHGYMPGGPSELRVTLSEPQASTLQNLLKERRENRSDWGLADDETIRHPWRFADRFYRACIEAWRLLLEALLEAYGVKRPPARMRRPVEEDHENASSASGRILIRDYSPVFHFIPDSNRAMLAGFYDWRVYRNLAAKYGRTILG
jgi:hypothetical protein